MNSTYTVSHSDSSEDVEQSANESDEAFDPSIKLDFSSSGNTPEKAKSGKKSKPKTKPTTSTAVPSNPSFVQMVVKAIGESKDPNGISLQAIKSYLKTEYNTDEQKVKRYLKRSIEKCLKEKKIVRCTKRGAKESTGITGRFKINTKNETLNKKPIKIKSSKASAKAKVVATPNMQLKSLRRKSVTVKVAQSKVKKARQTLRKSMGQTKSKKTEQTTKPKKPMPVLSVEAIPVKKEKKGKEEKTIQTRKNTKTEKKTKKVEVKKPGPKEKAATSKKKGKKSASPKNLKKTSNKTTTTKAKTTKRK